jgi:hypothetical protein
MAINATCVNWGAFCWCGACYFCTKPVVKQKTAAANSGFWEFLTSIFTRRQENQLFLPHPSREQLIFFTPFKAGVNEENQVLFWVHERICI